MNNRNAIVVDFNDHHKKQIDVICDTFKMTKSAVIRNLVINKESLLDLYEKALIEMNSIEKLSGIYERQPISS